MKSTIYTLLIIFSALASRAQVTLTETVKFKLIQPSYKEKVNYRYKLENNSNEVIKTFDQNYYFGRFNEMNLAIVSKTENKLYSYNIFNANTGEFILDWEAKEIRELNDSVFKLKKREEQKNDVTVYWIVIDKTGKQIIENRFPDFFGPIYDEQTKLIYSNNDKETVKLYGTNGQIKYEFNGYSFPRISEGNLILTKNNKEGILDFSGKTVVPFEYEKLDISDEKLLAVISKNNKSICEIYSDLSLTNLEFSREGTYIYKSNYYEPTSLKSTSYWMIANKDKQYFYDTNFELFLDGNGELDKNDSTYYFYWNISQKHNQFYLMQFDFGSGEKPPIVVSKEGQVLSLKNEEVVFCRQTIDEKTYENSVFTFLFDPVKKSKESLLIIDKQNKFIPYKVIYQVDNMIIFEIEQNGQKQIVRYDGEEGIHFYSKLNNPTTKLIAADRTFFKNPDLLFFSTIDKGKISILANYFMYGSDNYSIGQTPSVFDKITKIYANETYFHVVGIIDGKQVLAFCNNEKFKYVPVDKLPDMKLFGIEGYHNVVKIKSNNKIASINAMCEFIMEPKYNEIITYNSDFSFCIADKKKGVGYWQDEGKFDEILPAEFDEIELVLGGDLWKVKKDGKFGLFYGQGQKCLDCIFDEIILEGWDGGYMVKQDGKYGVMGYDGSVKHEIKYNSIEEMKKAVNHG